MGRCSGFFPVHRPWTSNQTSSEKSKSATKTPEYSLELRVQHLDGTVLPEGVVGRDALSSLEGGRELLDLVPGAQILFTGRLRQFCGVQLGYEFTFLSVYLLKVEARLHFRTRAGTPVVGLSCHQREQQEEKAEGRHCSFRRRWWGIIEDELQGASAGVEEGRIVEKWQKLRFCWRRMESKTFNPWSDFKTGFILTTEPRIRANVTNHSYIHL